jgi:hypothetical protein
LASLLGSRWLPRLHAASTTAGSAPVSRTYIADAQLLLFGRAILGRTNVGGGYAAIESSNNSLRLLFAGGSIPQRARGMNWMGFFEEHANEKTGPSYFGFMTTQPGKTGVQMGHTGGKDEACWYKASRAIFRGNCWDSLIQEIRFPEAAGYAQCSDVAARVRSDLAQMWDSKQRTQLDQPGGRPLTFLLAVREARRSGLPKFRCTYFGNGKLYTLETVRQHDQYGHRWDGLIHDKAGVKKGEFRIWYADPDGRSAESDIPIRIEYCPRPILRLTLRAPRAEEVSANPEPRAFSFAKEGE